MPTELGKHYSGCVRVSQISIWLYKMNEDHPYKYRWATSNLLRTQIEHKGRGKGNLFPLLELGHLCSWVSSLLIQTGTDTMVSLVLRMLSGLEWHQLSWVSGLHMGDHGTSQSGLSPEPIPHNKSFCVSIDILLVLFFWRIPTNTLLKHLLSAFSSHWRHYHIPRTQVGTWSLSPN